MGEMRSVRSQDAWEAQEFGEFGNFVFDNSHSSHFFPSDFTPGHHSGLR